MKNLNGLAALLLATALASASLADPVSATERLEADDNPLLDVADADGAADSVRGSVQISGCRVRARDLGIRARLVGRPRSPRRSTDHARIRHERRAGDDQGARESHGRGRTRYARGVREGASSRFLFRFEDLRRGQPYRIGVKLFGKSARDCPHIAWTVDREPLVLAGGAPVAFHGFAVRSELAILATPAGRDARRMPAEGLWVAADSIDYRDPVAAVRTFRWRSALPGVVGGQLQISLHPFPRIHQRDYAPCLGPDDERVIQRVDFDADPGVWTQIPAVDFHALLLGTRGGATRTDPSSAIDSRTLTKLDLGMPIYVRVVPLVGPDAQPECDPGRGGVPPEVIIAFVVPPVPIGPIEPDPQLALGTLIYTPPPLIGSHPHYGETCYRALKSHPLKNF